MAAAIPPKVSKIVDVFVSIAAAVVIWGALRKILHAPDADIWLKIGLTTEALVFLVYGILYLRYPAVDEHAGHAVAAAAPGDVVGSFDAASDGARIFHDQIQVLTKNLSSLNTIYELELQESNNHLKALNQFYGKLNDASNAMNTTASDAVKAKEQISALANNLGKLNQIYGSMISAMQGGKA